MTEVGGVALSDYSTRCMIEIPSVSRKQAPSTPLSWTSHLLVRLSPLLVFAIALATRLIRLDVPLNIDETLWIERGARFSIALLQGDFQATYLSHHPGVTNMWLAGGAFSLRFLLQDIWPLPSALRELAAIHPSLSGFLQALVSNGPMPVDAYAAIRPLFALVTAASLTAFYLLARKLFGGSIAAIATLYLLLEPFFLAYQRFITTDANQSNFTWLALLAFLLFLSPLSEGKRGARQWLLVSGVVYGLALLSKSPALLSLPTLVLATVGYGWLYYRRSGQAPWRRLLRDSLLWSLVVGATLFLLWPALLTDLPGTLTRLYRDFNGEVSGHIQFFLGQVTDSPGWAFYPLVLLLRLSPLLLAGTLTGALVLAMPRLRARLPNQAALFVIVLNLGIVVAGISSQESKLDRYMIPLIPGLALVAASGWVALFSQHPNPHLRQATGRSSFSRLILLVVASAACMIQVATVRMYFPYTVSYFNPLVGGASRAQELVMVGNGEFLDAAAAWLNAQPEAQGATVASWDPVATGAYYHGPTVTLWADAEGRWPWTDAHYVMLYVSQLQRSVPSAEQIAYITAQQPLHVVRAHELDYVYLYPGPTLLPSQLAAIPNSLRVDFGSSARLLGYDLSSPAAVGGDTITLTLFWEALASFPASDYQLYLRLRNSEGTIYREEVAVPVGGFLPVTQWEPGQYLRDMYRLTVPTGTPPGEYTLSISFFSPSTQQGLEIHDGQGSRGYEMALAPLTVTRPAAPLPSSTELGIDQRLPGSGLEVGGARLLGYEWAQPTSLRAGDAVPLTVLWQAGPSAEMEDAALYLQLCAEGDCWSRSAGHPRGGSYPIANWQPGELVRDSWKALLPADAPPGSYSLSLVATIHEEERRLLDLGTIEVEAREHRFDAPEPDVPVTAEWRDGIRLLGYDLLEDATASDALQLRLYWQALGEVEQSYTRFVQVLDAGGQVVAQHDSAPGNGAFPTTSWVTGEVLTEDVPLSLPAALAPGSFQTIVGFYNPVTGERLMTAEEFDFIQLPPSPS